MANINNFLLDELFSNKIMLDSFAKSCFDDFKIKHNNIDFGSVHYNYLIWVHFALITIKNNNNLTKISFPNGCCSKNDCPINLMYEIVLTKLMK